MKKREMEVDITKSRAEELERRERKSVGEETGNWLVMEKNEFQKQKS